MQLAFIGGVAEAAAAHGYDMLLSPAETADVDSFRRMVGPVPEHVEGHGAGGAPRVDGVIVMEIRREDGRVERLAEADFPFVAIGRNTAATGRAGSIWTSPDWRAAVYGTSPTWATTGSPSSTGPSSCSTSATASPGSATRATPPR
jgi:DNA-binding LacI/PurR family transcriptional regulator